MVNAKCVSLQLEFNPDEWPRQFVALPRKGELVTSNDGIETLTVVNVRHKVKIGSMRSVNEIRPKAEIILGR